MRVVMDPLEMARRPMSLAGALCVVDAVATWGVDPSWCDREGSGVTPPAITALMRAWDWSAELWQCGALETVAAVDELVDGVGAELGALGREERAGRAMSLLVGAAPRPAEEVGFELARALARGEGPAWLEVGVALAVARAASGGVSLALGDAAPSVAGKLEARMEREVWSAQLAAVGNADGEAIELWREEMAPEREALAAAMDELGVFVMEGAGAGAERDAIGGALAPAARAWEEAWRDAGRVVRDEFGASVKAFAVSLVERPAGMAREAALRASRVGEKRRRVESESGLVRREVCVRVRVLPWDVGASLDGG